MRVYKPSTSKPIALKLKSAVSEIYHDGSRLLQENLPARHCVTHTLSYLNPPLGTASADVICKEIQNEGAKLPMDLESWTGVSNGQFGQSRLADR